MPNAVFRLLAGMVPASRERGSSRARAAVVRAIPAPVATAEPLETRRLLAVTTLTNGTGDGAVTMGVDAYGSFGSNTSAGDAMFNPVGPEASQGTTFESAVYFSVLDNFLTESAFGNFTPPLLPITFLTTSATTATSSFTIGGMFIELTQTLQPATATGSILNQTYTVTNQTIATQTFQMVRHFDGQLFHTGTFGIDFGGASVNGQTLFQFDNALFPDVSTPYVAITSTGDGVDSGFTVQPFPYRNRLVAANGILNTDFNEVEGDFNGDRMTDTGYDVTLTLADTFTVDPGFSVTYTTTTVFSQGAPVAVLNPGVTSFAVDNFTVNENAGTATVTVRRTNGDEGAISVDYITTAGTATAGVDFTPVSGTVLFADEQTTATFTVPIIDDLVGEGDETILLGLSNPLNGAALGTPSTATLTILEDDLALLFSPKDWTFSETDGVATLTVLRTGPTTAPASVQYATVPGTATAPDDFIPTSGVLEFAAGQRTALITVPIVGDFNDTEQTERFTVDIANPNGAALGVFTTATVDIENVDRPPSIYDITAFVPDGRRITALYLKLNDEMVPGPMLDIANYRLFRYVDRPLGGDGARKAVPIREVRYSAELRTATIIPKRPLKNNVFYEVSVRGTGDNGVLSSDNLALDGDFNLFPGDDFIGYFARGNRVTYNDHEGDRVQLGTINGGVIEVFRDATRSARTIKFVEPTPPGAAIFGTVQRTRRAGDNVTDINTLDLNGAQSHLPSDKFRVSYKT